MKVLVLLAIIGGIMWTVIDAKSTADKKKDAELTAAKAQIVALQEQQQQRESAESNRAASLSLCLQQADWEYKEVAKKNGHYNSKTDIISAPVWAWQLAESKRTTDISECHMQYGKN